MLLAGIIDVGYRFIFLIHGTALCNTNYRVVVFFQAKLKGLSKYNKIRNIGTIQILTYGSATDQDQCTNSVVMSSYFIPTASTRISSSAQFKKCNKNGSSGVYAMQIAS